MSLSVYTYGAGEFLQKTFNAIAMTMEGDFKRYIAFVMVFAGFMAAKTYIKSRDPMELAQSVAMYLLVSSVLIAPGPTVQIIDEISILENRTVDNVPVGLSLPASVISGFFHSLTRKVESAFSIPDDAAYSKTGFLFASSMVNASSGFQIVDPKDKVNFNNFIQQCVFYDIHFGKYSFDDLLKSENIWRLVSSKPSPIRHFLLDGQSTSCKKGSIQLTERFKSVVDSSANRYAQAIFAQSSSNNHAELKARLISRLGTGYNFISSISKSGSEIMQQMIIANAVRDNALNNPALGGVSYVNTRADVQKFANNMSVGLLAIKWQPIMMGMFQCILYAMFIIVVFAALFNNGLSAVFNYIKSIIWIGSWPVIFAFFHLGASLTIDLASGGASISMLDFSDFNQTNVRLSSLFGYGVLMVPYLSWQIINISKQGLGSALMQLSQLVGGSTQSVAMAASAEAAAGNVSLGNASLGNTSGFNTSLFKHDSNQAYAGGAMTVTTTSGSTISQYQDGNSVLNQMPATSNLNTQIQLAESERLALSQQGDKAESAALNDSHSMNQSIDSAFRTYHELADHYSSNQSGGRSYSVSDNSSISNSFSELDQVIGRYAENHGVNKDEAFRKLAHASLNASLTGSVSSSNSAPGKAVKWLTGFSGDGRVSLSGGGTVEKSWTDGQTNSLTFSNEGVEQSNFTHALDNVQRSLEESNYRNNDEIGSRLSDSLNTSLNQAKQYSESHASNLSMAESYREAASYASEHASTINQNATQEFKDWLSEQSLHSGGGAMGDRGADALIQNQPDLARNFANRFVQIKTNDHVGTFKSSMTSHDAIRSTYQNASKVMSDVQIRSDYGKYHNKVSMEAEHKGLNDGMIDDQAKSNAKAMSAGLENNLNENLTRQKSAVDASRSHVDEKVNK